MGLSNRFTFVQGSVWIATLDSLRNTLRFRCQSGHRGATTNILLYLARLISKCNLQVIALTKAQRVLICSLRLYKITDSCDQVSIATNSLCALITVAKSRSRLDALQESKVCGLEHRLSQGTFGDLGCPLSSFVQINEPLIQALSFLITASFVLLCVGLGVNIAT